MRALLGAMPIRTQSAVSPLPLQERDSRPLIVVGITHPQTCLVLRGRLRALKAAGFRVVLVSSPGAWLDEMAEDEAVEAIPILICRRIAPLADMVSLVRLCRLLQR